MRIRRSRLPGLAAMRSWYCSVAYRVGMAQVGDDRSARAGGRAADDCGTRAEPAEQLVEIVGPDLLFPIPSFDQDVGGSGVAPVVQHDAHAVRGDLFGQRDKFVEAAAAAGDQREPGAAVAEHAVVNVDVANFE